MAVIVALPAMLCVSAARAHHSQAMFDSCKEIIIEGTVLGVTTEDGEIHPFYAGNTRTRTLTPAASLRDQCFGHSHERTVELRQASVERLSLTDDRLRLRYEITVEDPVYLSAPATLTQQWDHRPDLEFSPASEGCDREAAARYRDHVPE
jgi:hypothetical protein